ncbi:MAG: PIN domain-containing protein [Bacteroidales bacterium]|nr:PIN domain-containing protein [Bacteroidales bacterium]
MITRIFFDTNIMLDLILERPGYEHAARVLQMQEDGKFEVCLSILSIANIAYVLRKTVSSALIAPTLKQISSVVTVVPMDDAQLQKALLLDGPDMEDLLQVVCAKEKGCAVLLTHNIKDFRIRKGLHDSFALPEIQTPESFLQAYAR